MTYAQHSINVSQTAGKCISKCYGDGAINDLLGYAGSPYGTFGWDISRLRAVSPLASLWGEGPGKGRDDGPAKRLAAGRPNFLIFMS
jgi:hypothetical protein